MINLLPPQEIKRVKLLYQKRVFVVWVHVLAIVVLIAGVCFVPSYIYSQREKNELLAKKALLEKNETGELKKNLISTIGDMNIRLDGFKDTTFSSPVVASFVDPVIKARTPAVHLSDLGYALNSDGTARVGIFGVSNSRESILTFASNLRKAPGVVSVDVPITNFIKDSNIPFSITITVALK